MTPRERTLAVVARERPDRLPREFKLTPALLESFHQQHGDGDPADHFSLEVRDVFFAPPTDAARLQPVLSGRRAAVVESGRLGSGRMGRRREGRLDAPLRPHRASDAAAEQVGGVGAVSVSRSDAARAAPAPGGRGAASCTTASLFVIGFMEWTIFEIAWHMRGMEELFSDIAFNPPFAEYLLDRITEIRCFQARRYAAAGVDMLKIGDDMGTQIAMFISPQMYRQWFKPRHAAVIRAAREVRPDLPVCYHSDGKCLAIIPDLIEIGVTVLNPVQPECLDLAEVKKQFGDRLAFWGGIGTQTTMPFASAGRGLPHRARDDRHSRPGRLLPLPDARSGARSALGEHSRLSPGGGGISLRRLQQYRHVGMAVVLPSPFPATGRQCNCRPSKVTVENHHGILVSVRRIGSCSGRGE